MAKTQFPNSVNLKWSSAKETESRVNGVRKRNKHLSKMNPNIINIVIHAVAAAVSEPDRRPCRNSILSGNSYYEELVHEDCNPRRFSEIARMDYDTFMSLKRALKEKGLEGSINVGSGEKLMIFLYTITGHSNRETQERFQHSGETVSRVIKEVAGFIQLLTEDFITPPTEIVPPEIQSNSKFFPYFKDCIGALDGTHIIAVVPPALHKRFRNRKGFTSQNVLGVCNFDLTFSFVHAGWEGSAHDGRVLQDAVGLMYTPAGKYYLGDAGYALSPYCLTPYRGVRYHLKEWGSVDKRPSNAKELFNLRHASLRNAVERIFGVVKNRFPLLVRMPSYPFPFQVCFLFVL